MSLIKPVQYSSHGAAVWRQECNEEWNRKDMSSKLYRVNDTQRDFGSARSSHEIHQGLRK